MNSIVNENIKIVNNVNNKLVAIFENPFVKYGFLIFIVIRIILIGNISDYYLELMNNNIVKIIYALLVAYSACFDPVYAIALATFIIICIQELHNRRAKKAVASAVGASPLLPPMIGKTLELLPTPKYRPQEVSMVGMPDNSLLLKDKMVFDEINKHSLQRTPDKNDSMIAEYDYYQDPAYKTITANISEENYLSRNKLFVTDNNLQQIQTNMQPGSNQNVSYQAFPSSMNIQGLPNGFDRGISGSNPELSSIN